MVLHPRQLLLSTFWHTVETIPHTERTIFTVHKSFRMEDNLVQRVNQVHPDHKNPGSALMNTYNVHMFRLNDKAQCGMSWLCHALHIL